MARAPQPAAAARRTPTGEQQAIRAHAQANSEAGRKVAAFAGTGKTSTLEMLAQDRQDPGFYLVFNARVKEEAQKKFPRHIKVSTAHGAAFGAQRMHEQIGRLQAKLYGDGVQRLVDLPRCRIPADAVGQFALDAVKKFCNSAERQIGPEHVTLDPREPEANHAAVLAGARALFARMSDRDDTCPIIHDSYLKQWQLGEPRLQGREWIMFDESQDASPVMIDVMLRQNLPITWVGDANQCHPPETKILLTGGREVAIGDIKVGDSVVSYFTGKSVFKGLFAQGRRVEHVHRSLFRGKLVHVRAGDKDMLLTPNHRCLVRFNSDPAYALYLMRRGEQFRIGIADLHYKLGNGVTLRARCERADEAWILDAYPDKMEARIAEEKYCVMFGVPQLLWVDPKRRPHVQELLDRAWKEIGPNVRNGHEILAHFGRSPVFPLWSAATASKKMGNAGKYSFVTQACNVLSGCMSMVVMTKKPLNPGADKSSEWRPVNVSLRDYEGDVVGIQVEPTERGHRLYVANGIVVHNSIYQWRGAVNAMRIVPGEEFPLTQSFRFGKSIAAAANAVLRCKPEGLRPTVPLIGNPNRASQVGTIPRGIRHTFLSRTNAEWFKEALDFPGQVHVIGGLDETEKLLMSAYELWRNNARPERCSPAIARFTNWGQLCEHAEQFDDRELKFARNMVEKSYKDRLPGAIRALRRRHVAHEGDAELILSTAHKAKGLEWDYVRLSEGFTSPLDEAWGEMSEDIREAELNLLYVALTRGIQGLQPNQAILNCVDIAQGRARPGDNPPQRALPEIQTGAGMPAPPAQQVPPPRMEPAAREQPAERPQPATIAHPAQGKASWSSVHDGEILAMTKQGFCIEDVAAWLNRPPVAIAVRLALLGGAGDEFMDEIRAALDTPMTANVPRVTRRLQPVLVSPVPLPPQTAAFEDDDSGPVDYMDHFADVAVAAAPRR